MDGVVNGMPVIVYAARGQGGGDAKRAYGRSSTELFAHIGRLRQRHGILKQGTFHIIFLWSLGGVRMADVWIFNEAPGGVHDESGALLRVYIFKDMERCGQKEGLASSVTMPVLGAEAALRRDIIDLNRYIHSPDIYPAIPGLPLTPHYEGCP